MQKQTRNRNEQEALVNAIQICGSVRDLAEACDCSVQAVYKWIHSGLPIDRVPEVSGATGGRVRVDELYLGYSMAMRRRSMH